MTPAQDDVHAAGLPADALRWRCDPAWLEFETTREVAPLEGIVGQESAVEALRFGLEIDAPGQNIFVRGLAGSGRLTLVQELLHEISPPCGGASDRCYVHNFTQPDRPRLLTLPRGRGCALRDRVDELIDFVRRDLRSALTSDTVRARRADIERKAMAAVETESRPFDEELRANDLALVRVQMGTVERPMIVPLIDGEAVSPDAFEALRTEGKVDDAAAEKIGERIEAFRLKLEEVSERVQVIRNQQREDVRELLRAEARAALEAALFELRRSFPGDDVKTFLDELVDDVVTRRLGEIEEDLSFLELYQVNTIATHEPAAPCPVVVENYPTLERLVGSFDAGLQSDGSPLPAHMTLHSGSILRADGGFLILEARDVADDRAAWRALVRTLRTGLLEIAPAETSRRRGPTLKPESIPVSIKVVLIGSGGMYAALDALDADFPHLFKVLADFDTTVERGPQAIGYYAGFLARLARDEELQPFDKGAVAALIEHGARIAARRGKLTARLGRVADIAREAAHVARQAEKAVTGGAEVRAAVARTRRRADLPARKFREYVAEGTIRIRTSGTVVGQVNGLAVIHAGPIVYGFPTRITATLNPGTGGAINIEREADLSGAIHTKGFYILGGLLRSLLRTDHPLTFEASIAFEQSYGGIDGDSASGAEACCLLSALTEIPMRQDLAMTGAIDQKGHVQPIGAVNEKIEGFYDVCVDAGLTGEQGVIVPIANAGDLMLREDVVEACRADRFHVHTVDTVHEALELFTGRPAGTRGNDGRYPEGTFLGEAAERARLYWKLATKSGSTEP